MQVAYVRTSKNGQPYDRGLDAGHESNIGARAGASGVFGLTASVLVRWLLAVTPSQSEDVVLRTDILAGAFSSDTLQEGQCFPSGLLPVAR
jgi:hypothetical protein